MKIKKVKHKTDLLILTFLFSFCASCQESDKTKSYTIAYGSEKGEEVVLADIEGVSEVKLIGRDGGYLAWSPDGKQFAFYAKYDEKKTWSIHTMNVNGTNRKRLTQAKYKWDSAPAWSPDGKKIVFAREYKNEKGVSQTEIWIMNPARLPIPPPRH